MKKLVVYLILISLVMGSLFAQGKTEVAAADKVYKLKLGHIQPVDHPNAKGSVEFARLVKEKTGGRVEISIFPSNQLGDNNELYDACALGTVDFVVLGYGEPAKSFSPFLLMDAPYLADSREQFVRILQSDVFKDMCVEMEKVTGVETLGSFYYGARYVTTVDFPVRTPADLKGHLIRVPDQAMYVNTLNAMGATATPLAFSDLYISLQQKVVDGQENPLATIDSKKFDEVQKYLCKTEHIMGGNCIYTSSKTMKKLPAEYVSAIREAGLEACDFINTLAFKAEDSLKTGLQDRGMILIEDVDKAAFKESTLAVYEKLGHNWDAKTLAGIRAVN